MTTAQQITEIPLEDLHESPDNDRKVFNDADLAELADSIKANGRILQPLLVRPRIPELWAGTGDDNAVVGYEIVFGHRRYRAAHVAGLATAPCMVRAMTDAEAKRAQIAENLEREDLHPIEEAQGFAALIEHHGETADTIAEQTGKSRSYVYARLKLLQAVPLVRDACLSGKIDAEVALLIARLRVPKLQEKALSYIGGKGLSLEDGGKQSYRRIRSVIAEHFQMDLKKAPFPIHDAGLVATAGDCVSCPKRSSNAPEFQDVATEVKSHHYSTVAIGPNVCTDPDCHATKKLAHFKREADALRAKGKEVIDGNKARAATDAYGKLKDTFVPASGVSGALAAAKKAGKPTPQVVTIQDPRDGKLIEAVKVADLVATGLRQAAPAQANTSGQRQDRYAEERRENEAKAEAETTHRLGLLAAVRAKLRNTERTADEARAVALEMVTAFAEHDDARRLAQDWHVSKNDYGYSDRDNWQSTIDAMPPADVALLMIDCALISNTRIGGYELTSTADGLNAIALLHGLDPEAAYTPSTAAQAHTGLADDGADDQAGAADDDTPDGADSAGGTLDPAASTAAQAPELDAFGHPMSSWKRTTPPTPAWPFPRRRDEQPNTDQTDDAGCAGQPATATEAAP